MADLDIINADLFTAKAESIMITFDGVARTFGRTGEGFRINFPEEFIRLEKSIPYPIPIGSIYTYRPDKNFLYKAIFLASVLHHQGTPTDGEKIGFVTSAVKTAIRDANKYIIKSIAVPLMTGG